MKLREYMEQLNKELESLNGCDFETYTDFDKEYKRIVLSIFNSKEFEKIFAMHDRIQVKISNIKFIVDVFEVKTRMKFNSSKDKISVNVLIEKHPNLEDKYLDMEIKEFIRQFKIEEKITYLEYHKEQIKCLQDKISKHENHIKNYKKELEDLNGENLIKETDIRKSIVLTFSDERDNMIITERETIVVIKTDNKNFKEEFGGLVVSVYKDSIELYGESPIAWKDIKDIKIVTLKKIG